jgi:MFS family permease
MKNLTFSQKRSLTVFAFSVRMFLMGVEDAVIFPSIWPYLQMFHADYWYLGLVLSAYYTVGIASAILFGRLADGNMNLRFSGIVCNLAEVSITLPPRDMFKSSPHYFISKKFSNPLQI